jgi:tetratricopeptide (TPR) repeat protein
LDCLEKAIQEDPQHLESYELLAFVQTRLGYLEEALKSYEILLFLRPQYAPYFVERGQIKRSQKDFDGALKEYEQALFGDPHNVRASFDQGLLFFEGEDFEKADFFFQKSASSESLLD